MAGKHIVAGVRTPRVKVVTIRDVARSVGVSTASVSKALNNKPDISQALKSRILTLCEEMGYRLNSSIQDLARRGRGGLTRNIAFVMVGKAFADPAYARAIDGVSRAASERGLHLILDRLEGREARVIDLPPVLRDGRVDGILLTGNLTTTVVDTLAALGTPAVILGSYPPRMTARTDNVVIDLDRRIADLVAELARNGRRRIAYFTETADSFYERKSIDAFNTALHGHGLEPDGRLLYTGAGAFTGALSVMTPVFTRRVLPFDALVCLDFRSAQEISHLAMARAGIGGVPEVMLAVGRPFAYYRLPVPSFYCEISLDTVAYAGVEALLHRLNGGGADPPRRIVLRAAVSGAWSEQNER